MKTKITAAIIGLILAGSIQAKDHNVDIKFSKGISKKFRKAMDRDLSVLERLDFKKEADQETLKVLGLDSLNADSATKWLEDRVQVVIEELSSKKLEKKIKIEERYFNFENADVNPNIEIPTSTPSGKGVTVMSNLGAALYFAGKSAGSLFSFKVKTGFMKSETVKFSSPRAGLIMIGPGHFMERFDFDKDDRKAEANSYNRLATFFHEARHSDGAGKDLGFFHAVCPDGHDFQGLNACDRNLNGPYAVGAQMIKEFLKNCDNCNDEVQERMKLAYLGSTNRIIKVTKKVAEIDNFEVSLLQTTLDMKEILLPLLSGAELEAAQKEIAEIKAQILAIAEREGKIIEVPSKYVDASPEGRRIE